MNRDMLRRSLETVEQDLASGIALLTEELVARYPEPWLAQSPDGRYLLLDAVTTRAKVLAALAAFD